MGSGFRGIPSMRNHDRSSSSSSSSPPSRKGKKSGSDKPKQPQRGLGVAQLEQIRLRTQMGCGFPSLPINHGGRGGGSASSLPQDGMRMQGEYYAGPQSSPSSSYAHHPNYMMVYGNERPNLRYQDSQSTSASRWIPNVQDSSQFTQEGMASRHSFDHFEGSSQHRLDYLKSTGASSQNLDLSNHEELDLELRL